MFYICDWTKTALHCGVPCIQNLAILGDVRLEGDRCCFIAGVDKNSAVLSTGLSETLVSVKLHFWPTSRQRLVDSLWLGPVSLEGKQLRHRLIFGLFSRKANYTMLHGSFFVCLLVSLVLKNLWQYLDSSFKWFSTLFAGNKLHPVVTCLGEWKSLCPITGILSDTWANWDYVSFSRLTQFGFALDASSTAVGYIQ